MADNNWDRANERIHAGSRVENKIVAVWVALVAAFFLVLYNPGFVSGLMNGIPLPPNPLNIENAA